jgi:hypothetical protein
VPLQSNTTAWPKPPSSSKPGWPEHMSHNMTDGVLASFALPPIVLCCSASKGSDQDGRHGPKRTPQPERLRQRPGIPFQPRPSPSRNDQMAGKPPRSKTPLGLKFCNSGHVSRRRKVSVGLYSLLKNSRCCAFLKGRDFQSCRQVAQNERGLAAAGWFYNFGPHESELFSS